MGTCHDKPLNNGTISQTLVVYPETCIVSGNTIYPNGECIALSEEYRKNYKTYRDNLLEKHWDAKQDISKKENHRNYQKAIDLCHKTLSIYPDSLTVYEKKELYYHQDILNIYERMVNQFGGIHNKQIRRKVRKSIIETCFKTCGDVCSWEYCDICGKHTICEKCKKCICWGKIIYKHNYLVGFHVNMPFFEKPSNAYIFKDMYLEWL